MDTYSPWLETDDAAPANANSQDWYDRNEHPPDWVWMLDSYVGIKFNRASRWHPSREGSDVTSDRIGDDLVHRLWSGAGYLSDSPAGEAGVLEAYLEHGVSTAAQIFDYDNETRLIIKLAHTGHVIALIKRLHRWIDIEMQRAWRTEGDGGRVAWEHQLQMERNERLLLYASLLEDDSVFCGQVQQEVHTTGGDEDDYYVEALTLLKHDLQSHGQDLLPSERAIIMSVYERLVKLSSTTIVTIPSWFASPFELGGLFVKQSWQNAAVNVSEVEEDEETFVNRVATWESLNHPHIARLFAACHIGKRVHAHESGTALNTQLDMRRGHFKHWGAIYHCILGLEYLHRCGLALRDFSDACILITSSKAILNVRAVVKRNGSEPTSIKALSQTIFSRLKNGRDPNAIETDVESLVGFHYPRFLSDLEKPVLLAMCSLDLKRTLSYFQILQHLTDLIKATTGSIEHEFFSFYFNSQLRFSSPSGTSHLNESKPLRNVDISLTGVMGPTFQEAFDTLAQQFGKDSDKNEYPDCHVYRRLLDLYYQLRDRNNSSLPPSLLTNFQSIVRDFYHDQVTGRSLSSLNDFTASSVAMDVVTKSHVYHHQIDQVQVFPCVSSIASVHNWTGRWQHDIDTLLDQKQCIGSALSAIIEEMEAGTDQSVAFEEKLEESVTMAQFEITRRSGVYSAPMMNELRTALSRASRHIALPTVPLWFIPSFEIELGGYLAKGSFGAVYRGKWFRTEVVVKTLFGVSTADQRHEFFREANIWFMLNHPNIVKLYGACHVGPRPFFVCEWASNGTLVDEMARIAATAPVELNCWRQLREAAAGLQYLHDQGIVHGDLKGNNILIGNDRKVKIADFGLSRFQSDEMSGALGAYRYKAPEVLNGSPSTFASDVYSFAMCMIEAVTCEPPWGSQTADEAVKKLVKRGARPILDRPSWWWHNIQNQWQLIESMTVSDPRERPTMAQVVEALTDN